MSLKPKRASYRSAIAWLALNDGDGDPGALDVKYVDGLLSVALVADLFGVPTEQVATAVVSYRLKNRKLALMGRKDISNG